MGSAGGGAGVRRSRWRDLAMAVVALVLFFALLEGVLALVGVEPVTLREDPFVGPNIRKLKGYAPPTWRYRIGRFRLFFMVDQIDRIVYMLSVDDRRDAYR